MLSPAAARGAGRDTGTGSEPRVPAPASAHLQPCLSQHFAPSVGEHEQARRGPARHSGVALGPMGDRCSVGVPRR